MIMQRQSTWFRRKEDWARRYNIGGHNEKQNIEIIHIILDTLQEMLPDGDPRKELVSEDLITYVADRKGHDRRYAIAPDKIKAEIGWYPETMFEEGIKTDNSSGSSSMKTG